MLIQKLRLKRGWSQQQLAQASGLSVRTVQRIEAGQPASTETLKSLAAVFDVEFSTLNPEVAVNAEVNTPQELQEQEAFDHVRRLRGFYLHLLQSVILSAVLLAANLLTSPGYLWSLWAIGAWGIALVIDAFRVFRPAWMLGPEWERRQVEKRLGRPL
jgi:transcriptional regulator with XRE-family HTH domain